MGGGTLCVGVAVNLPPLCASRSQTVVRVCGVGILVMWLPTCISSGTVVRAWSGILVCACVLDVRESHTLLARRNAETGTPNTAHDTAHNTTHDSFHTGYNDTHRLVIPVSYASCRMCCKCASTDRQCPPFSERILRIIYAYVVRACSTDG